MIKQMGIGFPTQKSFVQEDTRTGISKSCVPDGQLEVPGDDTRLLVVPGGVPGELEDLGGEVLHHGGHVDGSPSAHPLGVVAFPVKRANRFVLYMICIPPLT